MLKIFTLITLVFVVTSCSESKLDSCKKEANKLWSNSSTEKLKDNNKAYWDAMKRCEADFG
jgi:hypothetical protein